MSLPILDELERLATKPALTYEERHLVELYRKEALPALIRVARAAALVDMALTKSLTSSGYRQGERQLHDVAWPKLRKALQQLRTAGTDEDKAAEMVALQQEMGLDD